MARVFDFWEFFKSTVGPGDSSWITKKKESHLQDKVHLDIIC